MPSAVATKRQPSMATVARPPRCMKPPRDVAPMVSATLARVKAVPGLAGDPCGTAAQLLRPPCESHADHAPRFGWQRLGECESEGVRSVSFSRGVKGAAETNPRDRPHLLPRLP